AEASAIEALARTADFSIKTAGIPASDVLELARNVIEGRVALAQGDANKAIERFEQAAGLQETLPYMEPPYWYLSGASIARGRVDAGGPTMRRVSSGAPLHVRRITAGPIMGSPNCIERAATPRRRARRKQNSRRPGSAIVNCCNYPSCDAHPAFDLRPGKLRDHR